jgi:subtilase family serine protease
MARCNAILLDFAKPNRHRGPSPTTTSSTSSTSTSTSSTSTTSTSTTSTSTTSTSSTTSTTSTTVPSTTSTTVAAGWCAFAAKGSPGGYEPCDLQSAYGLYQASATPFNAAPTVAIVDAYDDPNAASDLGTYRSEFGLPPLSCGGGSPCFTKVGQAGGALPTANGSWAQEISLDLDMVSAVCPHCNILLVEASTPSYANLGAAENYAASVAGVVAISNSYGGSDSSSDSTYDAYYHHPGIAITVSSGDSGYGVEYPASSQYVTAVGGTTLSPANNARGWSETVWGSAGSGCSANEPRLSWQQSLAGVSAVCTTRVEADVSADADPNTGVAVYDSYTYQGLSGWLVFGGTSVASPIIASVYALAGNAAAVLGGSYPYGHDASLNQVTSGSNGSCGGSYVCTAGTGTGDNYSGPAGLGTPNGTGAF